MNEELALRLTRSYKYNAKSIRVMLKQPNLNDSEKGHIFMELGQCRLIKTLLNAEFSDDSFILDYEVLQQQVFNALEGE